MAAFPFPRDAKHRRLVATWDHLEAQGEASVSEIATAIDANVHTVRASIRLLHQAKVVYVVRWDRHTYEATGRAGGGRMAPVYAIGPGPDAKQPRPHTRREREQAWYRRNRAEVLTKEIKRRRAAGQTPLVPVWLRGLR